MEAFGASVKCHSPTCPFQSKPLGGAFSIKPDLGATNSPLGEPGCRRLADQAQAYLGSGTPDRSLRCSDVELLLLRLGSSGGLV
jgi:hypothetical protein